MIKYLIWYVVMWWISTRLLTPVTIAIMIAIRGFHTPEAIDIYNCKIECTNARRSKHILNRRFNNVYANVGMGFIYLVFLISTWPVEVLRMIFLDVPDGIELYESRKIKEGA